MVKTQAALENIEQEITQTIQINNKTKTWQNL